MLEPGIVSGKACSVPTGAAELCRQQHRAVDLEADTGCRQAQTSQEAINDRAHAKCSVYLCAEVGLPRHTGSRLLPPAHALPAFVAAV